MSDTQNIFDIFESDPSFKIIMRRLLESSMEASFTGVMITEAGPGYPIVYVNPAFCELTGYGPYELLGKSPSLLQGPDTEQWVLNELKAKIESGEIFYGTTANYRKDGSKFIMEWKIVAIRNAEGDISHYLAIQREK